jgi:hypothetical protein
MDDPSPTMSRPAPNLVMVPFGAQIIQKVCNRLWLERRARRRRRGVDTLPVARRSRATGSSKVHGRSLQFPAVSVNRTKNPADTGMAVLHGNAPASIAHVASDALEAVVQGVERNAAPTRFRLTRLQNVEVQTCRTSARRPCREAGGGAFRASPVRADGGELGTDCVVGDCSAG